MMSLAASAPRRLLRRLGDDPWTAIAEAAARAGYVARGFVYVSVGAIALLYVVRIAPKPEGAVGALEAWGEWPIGIALLWATGLGLYGFAGWRALQSLLDADRQGRSLKALASRAGQAVSGVLYGGLAISVFGLLDAIEDLREPDDQAATREAIEAALALPYGVLLVEAAGLFVLAAGAGNMLRAAFDHFCRDLDCPHDARWWAGVLARAGYLARGVAMLPAGALLLIAGHRAQASEAEGMGGVLHIIGQQPWGRPVLMLLALGLIAFGLFAFVEARFRPIRAPKGLTDG